MSDPVPSSAISDATVGGLSVIVVTGGSTGDVLTKQSDGTYLPVTPSPQGITGSVGSTTNCLVKSSGTGGSTVQASGITVDSSNNVSGVGTVSSGAITTTGVVLLPNGTAAAPSISFSSDTDTGFFRQTTNTVGLGLNGSQTHSFQSDGSILLIGADAWLYSSNWAIRTTGAGIMNLFAGDGATPATVSCGSLTASALMCVGVYTFATVPSASSNSGKFLRISDRAQKHAYSDGTNWRFFGDDAVIS